MIDSASRPTLLEELDQRQDEVLRQLDQLNDQVEALICQYGTTRPPQPTGLTASTPQA